jgi:hypothetical protein
VFREDKLARWEGDEMPQSVVELNRSAGDKALKSPKDEDKSFLDGSRASSARTRRAPRDSHERAPRIAGAGGRMGQALVEAALGDRALR